MMSPPRWIRARASGPSTFISTGAFHGARSSVIVSEFDGNP